MSYAQHTAQGPVPENAQQMSPTCLLLFEEAQHKVCTHEMQSQCFPSKIINRGKWLQLKIVMTEALTGKEQTVSGNTLMMLFPGVRTCLLTEFNLTLGSRKFSSVEGGDRATKRAQHYNEHVG